MVQLRVDALVSAFRVPWAPGVWEKLLGLKEAAGRLGGKVSYDVAGIPFALYAQGAGSHEVRLVNGDATILASYAQEETRDGVHVPGWAVQVELRAAYLATHSRRAAVEYARQLASALTGSALQGERVRRVDLAADVAGVTFGVDDRPAFVGRSKRAGDYTPGAPDDERAWSGEAPDTRTYWARRAGTPLTGFSFSPGAALQARIYDKQAELEQYGDDHEKPAIERAAWRRGGWDGRAPVWRVEFQLRGDALAEFRGPGGDGVAVRDSLEQLLEQLDGVWQYCTRRWVRLIDRAQVPESGRKDRVPVDPRWQLLQEARFTADVPPAVRRRGRRGGPTLAQVVGTVLAYRAATGQLPPSAGRSPTRVFRDDVLALLELTDEIASERYVHQREAAVARFSSVDDLRMVEVASVA